MACFESGLQPSWVYAANSWGVAPGCNGSRRWRFNTAYKWLVASQELPALRKLGPDMSHWTMQVKGIGSGYWRAVGAAEELIEKAAEIPRTWLCGVGFARIFNG